MIWTSVVIFNVRYLRVYHCMKGPYAFGVYRGVGTKTLVIINDDLCAQHGPSRGRAKCLMLLVVLCDVELSRHEEAAADFKIYLLALYGRSTMHKGATDSVANHFIDRRQIRCRSFPVQLLERTLVFSVTSCSGRLRWGFREKLLVEGDERN